MYTYSCHFRQGRGDTKKNKQKQENGPMRDLHGNSYPAFDDQPDFPDCRYGGYRGDHGESDASGDCDGCGDCT